MREELNFAAFLQFSKANRCLDGGGSSRASNFIICCINHEHFEFVVFALNDLLIVSAAFSIAWTFRSSTFAIISDEEEVGAANDLACMMTDRIEFLSISISRFGGFDNFEWEDFCFLNFDGLLFTFSDVSPIVV